MLGCAVRVSAGAWAEIVISTPAGQRFTETDSHEHISVNPGGRVDADLWMAAYDAIRTESLSPCRDADCEYCH